MIDTNNDQNPIILEGRIELPREVAGLLVRQHVTVSPETLTRMARHLALLRQWNSYASLVSEGDLAQLESRHLFDSLSLVPYVWGCCGSLVDIGSGGGFPAIPIKCVFSDVPIVMIERSARKVGFLRKVVGRLGLQGVQIIHGAFPHDLPLGAQVGCVTARAVERSEEVLKAIQGWLPQGALYLNQLEPGSAGLGASFHVEHVEDEWTRLGLRRGRLDLVRRRT